MQTLYSLLLFVSQVFIKKSPHAQLEGGSVVIHTRKACLMEANGLLDDGDTSESLSSDAVVAYKSSLKTLLDQALAIEVNNRNE